MTVRELVGLMDSHSLVKIIRVNMVYAGYLSAIPEKLLDAVVKGFQTETELRRRDWEEAGTWEPLLPDVLPQYRFSDLDLRIYTGIRI